MHVRKNIHEYNLLEHITFCGWNFKGLDPKNAAESEYPRERERETEKNTCFPLKVQNALNFKKKKMYPRYPKLKDVWLSVSKNLWYPGNPVIYVL